MPLPMDPKSDAHPIAPDPVLLCSYPDYPPEAPPVFFGHYWLPHEAPPEPLRPNLLRLDYSAGLEGPLTAYHWNSGEPPSTVHYVRA
jgi:hypothetical protein